MRNAVSEVAPETAEVRLAQYVMGTVVEITVAPVAGEDHARNAAACALREFERIETVFSRFDPESELSRVNARAAFRPLDVSDELFALTSRGLQYSRHSDRAFSITLQPLVELWERSAAADRLPNQRYIDSALLLSHPDGVILDAERSSVSFAAPGVRLNFDGLAKGYAVDRARLILSGHGITHAMINAGSSSIGVLYPDDERSPWQLGVRHPVYSSACAACFLLDRPAASTSGTGERGSRIGNGWYSHVIDPSSGFPVTDLASATVVGEYAELMEVASKLVLLRGCEKGTRVCDNFGWAIDAVTLNQRGAGGDLLIQHPDSLSIAFEPEYDTSSSCVRGS